MTDDDIEKALAYASRMARERRAGLDTVRESVLRQFKNTTLHRFEIMPQMDVDFRAYVFFMKEADVAAANESGLAQRLMTFVYDHLELVGRGKKDELRVDFEFDSDENVQANFGGSYYARLH